ncbi:MAG TPA: ABC transporter substrate-binding protein [Methanocorpusculum sp.]|nr:ABC transporter substrate-binding protein [Methanocorpusculum sp.]
MQGATFKIMGTMLVLFLAVSFCVGAMSADTVSAANPTTAQPTSSQTLSAGNSSAAPIDTPIPVAVQTPAQWTPVTLTDDYGNQITIDKEPQRIVSLAPANTEIIFALGLGDRAFGVTEYCNYPEAATTKPIIGGYTTTNIERVVAQNPDLVLAYHGIGEGTVSHLKQLGLTVMTMNSDSVAGTLHDIELIGKATGKTAEAEQLTKNMQKRIDTITAKLKGITTTPTAFHCVWTDPFWVSGGKTLQDEIITFAGGQNLFKEVEGWGIITTERLLTTDPDYIIVDSSMGEGRYDAHKDYIITKPCLHELTAVKNNHVYVVNADIIGRGGPRIIDCLEQLAKILHPEIFGTEKHQAAGPTRTPGFGTILTLTAAACALYLIRKH